MSEKDELKGLRGWLVLVALGVVFSPIRLMLTYLPIYIPIFKDGTWEALTTVGSSAYHPMWAPLLIGEMTYNLLVVTVSLYLVYLFFSKHHFFPKLYIYLIAVSLLFIPLDAWLVTKVLPDEPMFDPATTKEFVRSLTTGVIWIPYMLISKRVKATFVEKRPLQSAPPTAE